MPKSKPVREEYELRDPADNATFNEAFQLAHSIYRYLGKHRTTALNIVGEALGGLEVRLTAQHEADRHDPQRPTKVRWTAGQWFQILIYCKSEKYERQQETQNRTSLSEEDMVIRYIKHLILTTSRRNSFHISLGLSRLLFNYSAAETMAIYDLVFQDPDNSTKKADAYYRARKNKLIDELEQRFRGFVRIDQGVRGERMFQQQEDSFRFIALVTEYLTRFTPWETICKLPVKLDTWTEVQTLLSSQASQSHSLIHPACFSRITTALHLDPPESSLAVPRFFLMTSGKPQSTGSSPPSELTAEEADEIRKRSADDERRRKKFVPHSLSVLADGIERARLNLAQSQRVRLDLEEDITLIEVLGHNKGAEVLLAAHLLIQDEDEPEASSNEFSIVLEGGQKISLTIMRAEPSAVDKSVSSLEISYQETKTLRAVSLWWRQQRDRLSETGSLRRWSNVPILSPKMGLALLVLVAAGIIFYTVLRSGSGSQPYIARNEPSPAAFENVGGPTPGATSSPQPSPTHTPQSISGPPSPEDRVKPSVTRDPTGRAVRSLLDIRRIYVQSLGGDAFSQSVHQSLVEKLQSLNRFVITKAPDDADTAIGGSVRQDRERTNQRTSRETEAGSVHIEILNVSGRVIWRSRTYFGTAEKVSTQFTKDFAAAIRAETRSLGPRR